MNPIWLQLILIAIQDAPAIAAAIEISKLPPLTDAQMTTLRTAMNDAVAKTDADIAAKWPTPKLTT